MNEGGTTTEDHPLLREQKESSHQNKGGFTTLLFIIGNNSLEEMAAISVTSNISLYMINEYHLEVTTASNVLYFWTSLSSLMPLFGALVADSYLGRFYTIGFGSIICCLGMVLLWLTAIFPEARPPHCDHQSSRTCSYPTSWQLMLFFASLGIFAIGGGGILSSSSAFGANQLQKGESEMRPDLKEKYFTWYYAALTASTLISMTAIVYIQDKFGWGIEFGVCALLVLCGVVLFFAASPFYIKSKVESNLLIGLVQVAVACYRNWDLKLTDDMQCCNWYSNNGELPSRRLRFLNKACVIRDLEKDLTLNGEAKNPWKLCSVQRVEELKSLVRLIPIWSSSVILSVTASQNTFPLLQANSMDRRITSNFSIPAASFGMFTIISILLWMVLYTAIILPLASKLRGSPVYISAKTRMGTGLFFSFISMIVTSFVESIRRHTAITAGLINEPQATVPMSALWVIPQGVFGGFSLATNYVALNEFYYSELPKSMSSLLSGFGALTSCFGSMAASLILNIVDVMTKEGGRKESWISSNINEGHYDYYYLVLAAISLVNIIYFLICSAAYGPVREERIKEDDEN